MYIMYVDESGDPGNEVGSSEHFILSGLIINYKDWAKKLALLKRMRSHLFKKYSLSTKIEVHTRELIRVKKIKEYRKIKKYDRMNIIKDYASFLPKMFEDCVVINISLRKADFPKVKDFMDYAFTRLITRYDMYLRRTVKDEGIIISDESSERKLRNLLRKMRIYNPIQSHYTSNTYNAKITRIIEDIIHRRSNTSYFVQTVDLITFLLYSKEYPKGSHKKHNLNVLFDKLDPILLKVASSKDPFGIVRN